MKNYKVIALSVGGLGNKIFNAGENVTEKNFIPGRADELVKLGFLKAVEEKEETLQISAVNFKKSDSSIKESDAEKGVLENILSKIKSIDEITLSEIKADLTELEIPFKSNDTKKALYDLWVKNLNE